MSDSEKMVQIYESFVLKCSIKIRFLKHSNHISVKLVIFVRVTFSVSVWYVSSNIYENSRMYIEEKRIKKYLEHMY